MLIVAPYIQAVAAQSRSLLHILARPCTQSVSGGVSSYSADTIEAALGTSFQNLREQNCKGSELSILLISLCLGKQITARSDLLASCPSSSVFGHYSTKG